MPYLLLGGAALVAGVSGLLGYTAGGGIKGASDGIKYAVLGVGAIVVAKQFGWFK